MLLCACDAYDACDSVILRCCDVTLGGSWCCFTSLIFTMCQRVVRRVASGYVTEKSFVREFFEGHVTDSVSGDNSLYSGGIKVFLGSLQYRLLTNGLCRPYRCYVGPMVFCLWELVVVMVLVIEVIIIIYTVVVVYDLLASFISGYVAVKQVSGGR